MYDAIETPRNDAHPLLDTERRVDLRTALDDEDVGILNAQFATDAVELVVLIERALGDTDLPAFRDATHTLIGAADNLGCLAIVRATESLRHRRLVQGEAVSANDVGLRLTLLQTIAALETERTQILPT